jgi:hypothetical protein
MVTVHDRRSFQGMTLLTVEFEPSPHLHALRRDLQHSR